MHHPLLDPSPTTASRIALLEPDCIYYSLAMDDHTGVAEQLPVLRYNTRKQYIARWFDRRACKQPSKALAANQGIGLKLQSNIDSLSDWKTSTWKMPRRTEGLCLVQTGINGFTLSGTAYKGASSR